MRLLSSIVIFLFVLSNSVYPKNLGKKKIVVSQGAKQANAKGASAKDKPKNFVSKSERSGKNEILVKEGIKRRQSKAKASTANNKTQKAKKNTKRFASSSKKNTAGKLSQKDRSQLKAKGGQTGGPNNGQKQKSKR